MRFNTVNEWLFWQEGLHPTEIDLGLDRLQNTLQNLSIEFSNAIVITIAGTNGKGSCAALLSEILRHGGYRVGTYTSPHLLRYSERIKINDCCINDTDLCAAFAHVDSARKKTSLTYFEFSTLAALVYFSQKQCDVLVLEVGLGGRLDAVNIIDPDIAIITSIGLDHTEWLGASRDEIAIEKCGILRHNGLLVCGEQDVPKTLLQQVDKNNVNACYINEYYSYRQTVDGWLLQVGESEMLALPLPALSGEFQLRNAATCITALSLLKNKLIISETHIIDGLKSVALAGRMQLLAHNPTQYVDVGHNQQAAEVLAQEIKSRLGAGGECHAVFAMLARKEADAVIGAMRDVITHWHLAPLAQANSISIPEIELIVNKYKEIEDITVESSSYSDIPHAWQAALHAAHPTRDVVLGFGSFYTVSEILIFV